MKVAIKTGLSLCLSLMAVATPGQAAELSMAVQPLLAADKFHWNAGTHALIEPEDIERFLAALDGTPPAWKEIYGEGHHSGLDDRLFALNRERDARRAGKPPLQWRIAFVWSGQLTDYDSQAKAFHVAVGPIVTPTRWGLVRFKPENLPANLLAAAPAPGPPGDIHVVITGTLIPEESLIYDFSHEDEGIGVIMPVVQIERIDFVYGHLPTRRH